MENKEIGITGIIEGKIKREINKVDINEILQS
jgi:hypothetical protein